MPTSTSQEHFVRIRVVGRDAARQLGSIDRNLRNTQRSVSGLQTSFVRLNGAIGLLAGAHIIGGAIKGAVRLVDSYQELGGRIKLVADATVGLEQAQDDLNAVAMETYASYDAIGTLYARTGMAMKGLQVSHEDLISATQTVANTLRLSGASAQETRSSMLQLSQAMASGKLAGDEYRSISENNVALMDLLSDALDKTRGELKKMSKDGLLTTEVVFQALLDSGEKYKKMVAGLPLTVGRAMTNLETAWQSLLEHSTSSADGVDTVAESIGSLADTLNDPVTQDAFAWLLSWGVQVVRGWAMIPGAFGLVQDQVDNWLRDIVDSRLEGEDKELAATAAMLDKKLKWQEEMHSKSEGALKNHWAQRVQVTRDGVAAVLKEREELNTGLFGIPLSTTADIYANRPKEGDGWFPGKEMTHPLKSLFDDEGGGGGSGEESDRSKALRAYAESISDAMLQIDLLIPKLTILDEAFFNGDIPEDLYQELVDGLIGVKEAAEEVELPLTAMDLAMNDIVAQFEELDEEHLQKAADNISGLGDAADDAADEIKTLSEEIGDGIEDWANQAGDAFLDFATGAKGAFSDLANSILRDLARIAIQQAIVKPLGSWMGSFFESENGNVFQDGHHVTAYASGGVLPGPTIFPMANGGIGLAGESGPEAVMPLTRINGKLGVQAKGGNTNVTVINNSGGESTVTEQRNAQGGMDIQVMIERSVDRYISSGGANSTFGSQFGARPMPR